MKSQVCMMTLSSPHSTQQEGRERNSADLSPVRTIRPPDRVTSLEEWCRLLVPLVVHLQPAAENDSLLLTIVQLDHPGTPARLVLASQPPQPLAPTS